MPEESRYMKETLFTVNLFNIFMTERELKMGATNFRQCSSMHSGCEEVVFVRMIKVSIVDGVDSIEMTKLRVNELAQLLAVDLSFLRAIPELLERLNLSAD